MSSAPTQDPHRTGRRALLLVVAVQAVGIGVIITLLADIQDRFGFPTWSLGLIAGVSFATTFLAHVLLAPLADRGWERRLIYASAVLTIVSLVWMAFAAELWEWVAARAILGGAEGALTSSGRRVMLSWDPGGHGRALSSLLAALLAGFLLGPPLGGVLNEIGTDVPFLAPAALVLLVFPLLTRIHPADYPRPATRLPRRELAALPGLTSGLILASSAWLMIGVFDAIWARYLTDLGADTLTIGFGFLLLVLPSVILTPHGGRLADRMNPIRLAVTAVILELPLIVAFGFAGSLTVLFAISVVQAVVWSYITPPAQAAVAKVSPPGQAAEAQGLIEAVGLLFAGVGAVGGAPLYDALGPRWLFTLVAIGIGLAAAVVVLMRRRWTAAFAAAPAS